MPLQLKHWPLKRSAFSLASVVACFLFGLGLGASVFGRFADRIGRPLRGYALCELGIGIFALAIPFELAWLTRLAASIYPFFEERSLLLGLVRIALTLLILLPPTFLMGGTLPLLVRLLSRAGVSLGSSTRKLSRK